MTEEIKIYELKRHDLRGAVVIDGFPSVGLVSTITANYLISALDLEQIGILDSIHFPTVSVVRNSEPLNPVRIYAGEYMKNGDEPQQIVVFILQYVFPIKLHHDVFPSDQMLCCFLQFLLRYFQSIRIFGFSGFNRPRFFFSHLFRGPLNDDIKYRNQHNTENCPAQHPAANSSPQRLATNRTGTGGDHQREHTENKRHRRHQQRTKT